MPQRFSVPCSLRIIRQANAHFIILCVSRDLLYLMREPGFIIYVILCVSLPLRAYGLILHKTCGNISSVPACFMSFLAEAVFKRCFSGVLTSFPVLLPLFTSVLPLFQLLLHRFHCFSTVSTPFTLYRMFPVSFTFKPCIHRIHRIHTRVHPVHHPRTARHVRQRDNTACTPQAVERCCMVTQRSGFSAGSSQNSVSLEVPRLETTSLCQAKPFYVSGNVIKSRHVKHVSGLSVAY